MIGSKGGRRRERKRDEREGEEGVKVWKEAEDGDKCDRDRMLGKVRRIYGGGGGGGGWERDGEFGWAEKKGEQLKPQGDSRFVGDPSEVLARTVGEGVRKMMKERERCKKGSETLGCVVC